jgi:RNA polymerase sigma factor (TIGR02999 family)
MQPTALLHEAWMKVATSSSKYNDREHFMAVAARAMRQILVDRARARLSQKRGGGWEQVTLSGIGEDGEQVLDVLDLDDALEQLEQVDADVAQVAVLRTFGGMTAPEAAAALNTSVRTLQRQWRFARVFLAQPLGGGVSSDDRSPQGGRPTPAGVPRSSVTRYGTNPR